MLFVGIGCRVQNARAARNLCQGRYIYTAVNDQQWPSGAWEKLENWTADDNCHSNAGKNQWIFVSLFRHIATGKVIIYAYKYTPMSWIESALLFGLADLIFSRHGWRHRRSGPGKLNVWSLKGSRATFRWLRVIFVNWRATQIWYVWKKFIRAGVMCFVACW